MRYVGTVTGTSPQIPIAVFLINQGYALNSLESGNIPRRLGPTDCGRPRIVSDVRSRVGVNLHGRVRPDAVVR